MRYRTEMVSQILYTAMASFGARMAEIAYNAFISYNQMKEYVIILNENDLLDYDLYTQTYKTTQKGIRFLKVYNEGGDVIMTKKEEEHISKMTTN